MFAERSEVMLAERSEVMFAERSEVMSAERSEVMSSERSEYMFPDCSEVKFAERSSQGKYIKTLRLKPSKFYGMKAPFKPSAGTSRKANRRPHSSVLQELAGNAPVVLFSASMHIYIYLCIYTYI